MTGLEVYLIVSPFVLLAIAGAVTWFLVGRENAPLGSKANRTIPKTPSFYQMSAFQGASSPQPTIVEKKATHKAPSVHQ